MELKTLTDEQTETLSIWRAMALERMPYFAPTLYSLRCVNAPGLGTFAVDPHHRLYVDFDAVEPMGATFCAEALLHECSHLLGAHAMLADELDITDEDRRLWNVAGDASINDDLVASGCRTLKENGVLPENIGQPDNETAPFYFRALKELQQKNQKNQPQSGQGGEQGQQGQGGQQQDQGGQSGENGQEEQVPYSGCGSGSGGQSAPCELDESDDMGGAAAAAGGMERERIRIQTAAAIREHVAKGRGKVPGGFVQIADAILTPSKTPWDRLLAGLVRRTLHKQLGQNDTDRSRRSRRRHNAVIGSRSGGSRGKVVYPANYNPVPRIEVIRDTSGSMSAHDLAVVTSEVEAIAKRLGIRGESLIVTDVDAAVHESRAYTGAASLAEVTGRGGTNMAVGIEAAEARRDPASIIVVITDGGTPWPATPGRIPVVAAVVESEATYEYLSEHIPPYIKHIHVDPSDFEVVRDSAA